jgi:signal transduction histidine kinase
MIDLTSAKDRTILSLRDDGIGFPRKVRNYKGVGLQIMKCRASMIGGTLTIQPETNGGTAVICSIQKSESASSNRRKLDYEEEISNAKE